MSSNIHVFGTLDKCELRKLFWLHLICFLISVVCFVWFEFMFAWQPEWYSISIYSPQHIANLFFLFAGITFCGYRLYWNTYYLYLHPEFLTPVTSFQVDRSKWRKGGMVDQGGRCCIFGFYFRALGYKDQDMLAAVTPADLLRKVKSAKLDPRCEWVFNDYFYATQIMSTLNDNFNGSDEERECQLQMAFEMHGIDVEFVGEKESKT